MVIKTRSFPRAALIGNPSDGYYGKTIAFPFDNFTARVSLYESPGIKIIPSKYDSSVFESMEKLSEHVRLYGYYGGIRLIKAAIKRFFEYFSAREEQLKKNFTLQYESDIPFRLGLAGSSAIITASIKAMLQYYELELSLHELANLVLSVEQEELGIAAGLQDRVVQAYECPVYMDFNKYLMRKQGYGRYMILRKDIFPGHLYIAYRKDLSEGSEVVHYSLRERYNLGQQEVLEAIKTWTDLTDQVKDLLEKGQFDGLPELLNLNFDIRRQVMDISPQNLEMIQVARDVGASAKFTGSGGAIIGTYEDEAMFDALRIRMDQLNIEVIKPNIVSSSTKGS